MQRTLKIRTDSYKRYSYWKNKLEELGIKYEEFPYGEIKQLTIECLDEELDLSKTSNILAYRRTLKGICEILCIPYEHVEFYYAE